MKSVTVALLDKAVAAPAMHGGLRDAEARGDLRGCRRAPVTQTSVTARQVVSTADKGDLLEIERLGFPCAQPPLVEDIGDLAITVAVEKPVDLGDDLLLELADLGDGQRSVQLERARGITGQPNVCGNRVVLIRVT